MAELRVWRVVETAGYEAAWVDIEGITVSARGHSAAQLPEAYSLAYRLQTHSDAATTAMHVTVSVADRTRELELRRGPGGWVVNGQPRPDLAEALDCDLAACPVTNTMPILRHGLHRGPGAEDFVMAFIECPSLSVRPVQQRYEHLELTNGGARIRYRAGTFVSDLLVDERGLVVDYPTMAHRVPAAPNIEG